MISITELELKIFQHYFNTACAAAKSELQMLNFYSLMHSDFSLSTTNFQFFINQSFFLFLFQQLIQIR